MFNVIVDSELRLLKDEAYTERREDARNDFTMEKSLLDRILAVIDVFVFEVDFVHDISMTLLLNQSLSNI